MKAAGDYLLDATEMRMLEGLRLAPRNVSGGRIRGDRLTKKRGVSIEFADFRDYVDGDDVRHLDWNVLARMQAPVIRTYRDEEDIAVYVILDVSPSMDFGEPTKLLGAKKLCAAISFIALTGGDAVHLMAACATLAPSRSHRGRASFIRVDDWLAVASLTRERSLRDSLYAFASGKSRSGLVYIISDGLDPRAPESVAQLASRGHEVSFVQVLAREEIDPDIEGDLRLVDSEDESSVEITATSQALRQYKQNLDKHCESINNACVRYGGRYARVASDCEVGDFIRNVLRPEGWVA
jgi:uncharacterized protein (DUF58 family)